MASLLLELKHASTATLNERGILGQKNGGHILTVAPVKQSIILDPFNPRPPMKKPSDRIKEILGEWNDRSSPNWRKINYSTSAAIIQYLNEIYEMNKIVEYNKNTGEPRTSGDLLLDSIKNK